MYPPFLINDFVLCEDICNGSCSYCLTGVSKLKESHQDIMSDDTPRFHNKKLRSEDFTYGENTALSRRVNNCISILKNNFNYEILKISGGEILLLKNIVDFITNQSALNKKVQLLTNGYLLNNLLLDKLKDLNNLYLQISLDGHTIQANQCRTRNKEKLDRLLGNIIYASRINLPLEINCVLTRYNIDHLPDFLEYLLPFENLLIQPYPIRGLERDKFFPLPEQIRSLEIVLERFDRFKKILPPKSYMEKLFRFMSTGRRDSLCYIPLLIFQSFDDGIITPCPNIWFKQVSDILKSENGIKDFRKDVFYSVLKRMNYTLKQCEYCFTPWEILNQYYLNEISREEIASLSLYNGINLLEFRDGKLSAPCAPNQIEP